MFPITTASSCLLMKPFPSLNESYQETHYESKGMIKIDDFEVFESIRNKVKGGTVIGVKADLKPVLIVEYSDQFELLVVEIRAGNRDIRIISGYGPQENWDI